MLLVTSAPKARWHSSCSRLAFAEGSCVVVSRAFVTVDQRRLAPRLYESQIAVSFKIETPFAELFEIAKRLCDGSYTVIDKGAIRSVLRSLKMQTYIEKWLQVIHRIAKIDSPSHAWQDARVVARRARLQCDKLCMFFPLIKSSQKLQQLDDTFTSICRYLKWEVKPLKNIAAFAVQLKEPA
ncbi:MAG: hypothetical protein SGPRY_008766 [Prymnesium sp.]